MTTEIKSIRDLNALPPEERKAVLRSMPTEQLLQLKGQSAPPPVTKTPTISAAPSAQGSSRLSSLSTEELESLKTVSPQERDRFLRGVSIRNPGIGDQILEGAIEVGRFVDRYTGAPARAGLSAAINNENPLAAYATQFGEDPELAPTGKDIAKQVGVSSEPMFKLPVIGDVSPAGVVGFGVDILADPTTVIPVGAIARGVGKAAASTTKAAAKATANAVIAGTQKAAELARMTKAGEKIATSTGKYTKPVAEGLSTTGRALAKLFNPKVADDFSELKLVAQKNGINPNILPEGVEFGENSIITRAARVQREGLLGEELLNNFNDGLMQVQKATDKTISEIGNGVVLSKVDAGAVLRDSFDKGVDKVLSNASTTYNSIVKEYPGLRLSDEAMEKLASDIGGLERFAKRTATRGFSSGQRSQGKQLLQSVDAIRKNNGSFKQMVESLQDIGQVAFKKKNQLELDPPDIERLQKLYGDIKDALFETIRTDVKDGEAVAGALQINNELISELFTNKSVVSRVLGNPSLGPEKVFDSLVRNGDTAKIEALKNVIDANDWKMIKGAFVDSLIKRADDGSFSFRELSNVMRNKKDIIGAILSPEEIEQIAELTRLGDRWGVAVMSTSGTGASNIFRDAVGAIKQGITNDAFIKVLKERARNIQYLPDRPSGFFIPELPAPRPGQVFMLPDVQIKPRNKALEAAKQGTKVISIQDRNQREGK